MSRFYPTQPRSFEYNSAFDTRINSAPSKATADEAIPISLQQLRGDA